MSKFIAIVYPYDQETALERQLASRVQVEKLINPVSIETFRYDKVLLVGRRELFAKSTLDKVLILSEKNPSLFEWVDDSCGKSAEILHNIPSLSELGAYQSQSSCAIEMNDDQKFTILFNHQRDTLYEWRMHVKKGGSGFATLSFFDVDAGGKLLRTYDVFLSEFTDGWFSFKLPNPIFKANKKLAVVFDVKQISGAKPSWFAYQGWSNHSMLINQAKSDFVCCFETL